MSASPSPSGDSHRNAPLGDFLVDLLAETARETGDARDSARPGPPCLYSNKCTGSPKEADPNLNALRGQHRKTAHALRLNVEGLINQAGVENTIMLTLTFRENLRDPKEAQRRLHSLITHQITPFFPLWVRVVERQSRGALHYHFIIGLHEDVRTGFDFGAYQSALDWAKRALAAKKRKDRAAFQEARANERRQKERFQQSGSPHLQAIWRRFEEKLTRYGFGPVYDAAPIKSKGEAIAAYVGKYVSKHIGNRIPEDKGLRLMATSSQCRFATVRFSWASVGSYLWRQKLKLVSRSLAEASAGIRVVTKDGRGVNLGLLDFQDAFDFTRVFGRTWAFHLSDNLKRIRLNHQEGGFTYATGRAARKDGHEVPEDMLDQRVHVPPPPDFKPIDRFYRWPDWSVPDDDVPEEGEKPTPVVSPESEERRRVMREYARKLESRKLGSVEIHEWLRNFRL